MNSAPWRRWEASRNKWRRRYWTHKPVPEIPKIPKIPEIPEIPEKQTCGLGL
jgi:hypothetical protein